MDYFCLNNLILLQADWPLESADAMPCLKYNIFLSKLKLNFNTHKSIHGILNGILMR